MTALLFAVAGLACWALYRRRHGGPESSRVEGWLATASAFRPSGALTGTCLALLAGTFIAHLAALSIQPYADPTVVPWASAMPLPLLSEDTPLHPGIHAVFTVLILIFVLVESAALAVLAAGAAFFESGRGRRLLFGAAGVMALAAILAPVLSTRDVYEYVQIGWLGLRAYAPGNVSLPPQFAAAAAHAPVGGLIYGPLWLLGDRAVTALGSTVLAKIFALRLFSAAVFAAMLAVMAKAGIARRAVVVCALNPAIWFYFVTNAHIDIQAVALLIVAYAFSERKLFAAAGFFVVLAGLIKISFLVVGGVLLCRMQPVWRRAALWAGIVICGLFVSYAFGGNAYFHDLLGYSSGRGADKSAALHVLVLAGFALVLVLTVTGTLSERWFTGAPWLFPALSPMAFPWYLLSGLPYALASKRGLTIFLVTMPIAAAAIDGIDDLFTVACFAAALLNGLLAADLVTASRRVAPPSTA